MTVFYLTSGDCPRCGHWAGETVVFCQGCRVESKEAEQLWR